MPPPSGIPPPGLALPPGLDPHDPEAVRQWHLAVMAADGYHPFASSYGQEEGGSRRGVPPHGPPPGFPPFMPPGMWPGPPFMPPRMPPARSPGCFPPFPPGCQPPPGFLDGESPPSHSPPPRSPTMQPPKNGKRIHPREQGAEPHMIDRHSGPRPELSPMKMQQMGSPPQHGRTTPPGPNSKARSIPGDLYSRALPLERDQPPEGEHPRQRQRVMEEAKRPPQQQRQQQRQQRQHQQQQRQQPQQQQQQSQQQHKPQQQQQQQQQQHNQLQKQRNVTADINTVRVTTPLAMDEGTKGGCGPWGSVGSPGEQPAQDKSKSREAEAGGVATDEDEQEAKKERRKQSNRESARRSRLRKQAETEVLANRILVLHQLNASLKEELFQVSRTRDDLLQQQGALQSQVDMLTREGMIESMRG